MVHFWFSYDIGGYELVTATGSHFWKRVSYAQWSMDIGFAIAHVECIRLEQLLTFTIVLPV